LAGASAGIVPPTLPGAGSIASPPMMAPRSPDSPPDASDVLNPFRCATEHRFVLSIDPGGDAGQVQGWLESASTVLFDESHLPRFGASGPTDGLQADLSLWWSIYTLDEENGPGFWFYGAPATEIAHVAGGGGVADARQLVYTTQSLGPVAVGDTLVAHHIPTDRYLAIPATALYGTEDRTMRGECAAIDARWRFAPRGTADLSRTP
jgi:hypothetical protein